MILAPGRWIWEAARVDLTEPTRRIRLKRCRLTAVDLSKSSRRINDWRRGCYTGGSWQGHETTPARTRRSRRFWWGHETTPTRCSERLLDVHGGRSIRRRNIATSCRVSKTRHTIQVVVKQEIKGTSGNDKLSSKRKTGLIENNVTRDDDLMRREVETTVPFMRRGISQENAGSRARSKLMLGGCMEIRVAKAPEDTQVHVEGRRLKEACVGDLVTNGR